VPVGNLTLLVKGTEKFWEGEDSGRQEDMPGTFLELSIDVEKCTEGSSPLELLAARYKVRLFESQKEISDEPKGYAELKYKQLLSLVRTHPEEYTRKIQSAVKKVL
jgi:hypothetical protein